MIVCTADIALRGVPDRPEIVTGEVVCPQLSQTTCTDDFDPFHLGSCPFGCGRRPGGVRAMRLRRVDPLRDHLAQIALMEALSVGAFAQLEADLHRHAPRLLPRIARAQQDERRHARHARTLLRGLGGVAPRTPRVPRLDRTLAQVALDNAVEGCVHETFGAIVTGLQARRAGNARMRAFFASIAGDEIGHASLSWDVHDALGPQLSRRERAEISAAQRRAIDLIEETPPLAESVRGPLGAPTFRERRALLVALRASLPGVT